MYGSGDEFKIRLGQDTVNGIYGTDSAPADADLATANAEVEAALAGRYAVPVTAPGARGLLKDWVLTLAVERAHLRDAAPELPKKVKDRVDEIRKQLALIAEGKFLLADAARVSDQVGGVVIAESNEPEFTREKLAGW